MSNDEIFSKIVQKIESKEREIVRNLEHHKRREMNDLVQYYEGADWALNYALKVIREES